MRLIRFHLPLMTFALCFAVSSAAEVLGQEGPHQVAPRRVVSTGRLIGTSEIQQVVTWQTGGTAHLAIVTRGPRSRILWQTDGGNASRVDSVRVSDLDGDGLPEIISLWWKRSFTDAELRVVHWGRQQDSFIELQSENEINRVRSYRVVRVPGNRSSSRIVIERAEESARRPTARDIAYELRGSLLVRVGGDRIVTTQGESGIEGHAVISPVRPGPQRQGESSSAPYKTTLVVWSADGDREVTRFETGSDGRFRVALAPGTYRVGSPRATGRLLPRASEETVTVEAGKYVRVTITFDSGMR